MRLPHCGRTLPEIRWRLHAEPSYFDDVADEGQRCVHACLHTAEGGGASLQAPRAIKLARVEAVGEVGML